MRLATTRAGRTAIAPELPPAWRDRDASLRHKAEVYSLPAKWLHPRHRRFLPAWLVNLIATRHETHEVDQGFQEWHHLCCEIEHALIPTIRHASWKEKAGRIMHELANAVSLVDAPLQSVASGLDRSILDLRYLGEEAEHATADSTPSVHLSTAIERLQSTVVSFDYLRKSHEAAKNKVLWHSWQKAS